MHEVYIPQRKDKQAQDEELTQKENIWILKIKSQV